MKVTLVLVTGKNFSQKNTGDFTDYLIDNKRFRVTKGPVEVPKVRATVSKIDLLWIRPSGTRRHQEDQLPLLNPHMELLDKGSGRYLFSFRVSAWPEFEFDSELSQNDALVVVIRHWVSRIKSDARLTGLDWYVAWAESKLRAKHYVGEDSHDFVFNDKPYIFLAGLRAGLEGQLVASNQLEFGWLLDKALPKAVEQSSKLIPVREYRAVESTLREGSLGNTLPQRRDTTNSDNCFAMWIYRDNGREAGSARLAAGLPSPGSSRFLIMPWAKQEAWHKHEDSIEIAEAINLRKGDIVLAHGFDGKEDFKHALKDVGIHIMDYSPLDESWQRYVEAPLRHCKTAADAREVIIAYALQTYALQTEPRHPVDLIRRILHRAVNRLAPLRIDVAVISELVRDKNTMGISDHLFEMRKAWEEQPESRPLCCIASLHSMLVRKVEGLPVSLFGANLPVASLNTDSVLCEQLDSKMISDRVRKVIEPLIYISGLEKFHEDSEIYGARKASSVLQYIHRLEDALFEVDSKEKSLRLARDLVTSAQQHQPDTVAVWLGLGGFSYAAWLEKLSTLLEVLLEAQVESLSS